jgi:uncharacterized protein YbjT (DUF2867 family)
MRVLVLGASGGTGRHLVAGALARGHEVTAVARHLDDFEPCPGLTLRPADIRDEAAVRGVAAGHDAAISVLGSRTRTPGGIYSEGVSAVVRALEAEGVPRFVCVSSGGVYAQDRGLPLWYRLAIPLFLGKLYQDMRKMEDVVRASPLDWTLVRSAYLVDQSARGRYRVEDGRNPAGGWRIARADLAGFLLDQLGSDRWLRATPTLAY